jgi:hypothetical protein
MGVRLTTKAMLRASLIVATAPPARHIRSQQHNSLLFASSERYSPTC